MPLRVLAQTDSRTHRRLTLFFVVLLLTGCIVGIVVPAGLGWDFANFYDAGRRVAAGQIQDLYNPSNFIAGRAPQGTTGFYGTPISALLYVPLSPFRAETALVLFKIQNVLAFFAAFVVLFRFSERFMPDDESVRWKFAALFTFLCLIYQPFWTVFRVGGQTTPTVFLLLAIALVFHTDARFGGAALCVVIATLIKPALAPALLFLMCVSGRRFLLKAMAVLGACGLAAFLLMGWPAHRAFLELVLAEAQTIYPWYYNSSLYILPDNLRTVLGAQGAMGFQELLFPAFVYGIKVLVLGTVGYLTLRSRSQIGSAAARRHFDFMMAIVFYLLWSLTLWEHYLAVLFLPLVYIVASRQHFSREALVLVAAIFVLSLGQNLIVTNLVRQHVVFDSWFALLGIGLFKSGPLLLTVVLLWRHHQELFGSYATPAWERAPLTPGTR